MKTVSNAPGKRKKKLVFGRAIPVPYIYWVKPRAKEDETGRSCGPGRRLLTELLALAGIDRQDVYITGSCKCRPPKNRNPYRKELAACRPLLERQIEIIKPRVVVCMGLVAVHNLLDRRARLADVRGRWFDGPSYKIYPTYHPAAVLRGTVKAHVMVTDFRRVAEAVQARLVD